MTARIAHYKGTRSTVGVAGPVPRDITRVEVEAALVAHHGRLPPYDQEAMQQIEFANANLARMSNVPDGDDAVHRGQHADWARWEGRILPALRRLGLYPVTA